MPRKTNETHSESLPPELQNSRPSRDLSTQLSYNEWSIKNARAKAIIMSTLVRGSEAWKIAEPLEYASDIWEALEKKYGPRDDISKMRHPGTSSVEGKGVLNAALDLDHTDDPAKFVPNRQPFNVMASGSRTEASASNPRLPASQDKDSSSAEVQTHQERRDKRFLWALLNGGKDKLDAVTVETGQQLCGL